jgi:uncharacterized repeat protein (TIGR01451 family)
VGRDKSIELEPTEARHHTSGEVAIRMRAGTKSYAFSLTLFLLCVVAQAQQPSEPSKGLQCPHAWTITPADPKLATKSDAWTTATSDQDGILSISYCWVFQPGLTTAKRIPKDSLTQLSANLESHRRYAEAAGEKIRTDALPLGFTVYNNLAFELETKAVFDAASVTLRLPSVTSEAEFNKLGLLYLDEGQIVPGVLEWQNYPEYLRVQKSDFKSRTLTAGFSYTSVFHHATGSGRLIVASFNKEQYDKSTVDLYINSVVGPPYVKVGETFSYSISVKNSGATGRPANDVVVLSVINNGRFVSATTSQGNCRQSVNSTPEIVCELGTLDFGKTAVMTINIKAEDMGMMRDEKETVFSTMNEVQSRNPDYSPENNHYQSLGTIIRR